MHKIESKVQARIADSLSFCAKRSQLSAAMKVADSDLHSFEEKGVQAGILKNFQTRVMDSAEGREFITTSNYGPYLPELLPIIIAWYPNFPLKDLISVQDMEQDLAYIITSELLTGTNKAPTLSGQKVETPNGLREIKGTYPSGEVLGEVLTADDFQTEDGAKVAAVVYYPILTQEENLEQTQIILKTAEKPAEGSNPAVPASEKVLAVKAVVGEEIQFESEDGTITAVLSTQDGILSIKGGTYDSAEVSYVWNIEFADDKNIPTVVEDMKMIPMIAKARVLSMKWTIFSELVKKKQFGDDIRTQNTKRVLDLLYQYLVRYILDRMYRFAAGGSVEIKGPVQPIVDPNFKAQEILRQLNAASMIIANNTGRIEGNRLVIGSNFKNYLEALPDNWYQPEKGEDYGFQGPRKLGTFGRYMVFYDNELPANAAWMTYKGTQWYDASYYLGVFMPMAATDAININIHVQGAFVDMVAHRFDKPQGVVKLTFDQNV